MIRLLCLSGLILFFPVAAQAEPIVQVDFNLDPEVQEEILMLIDSLRENMTGILSEFLTFFFWTWVLFKVYQLRHTRRLDKLIGALKEQRR